MLVLIEKIPCLESFCNVDFYPLGTKYANGPKHHAPSAFDAGRFGQRELDFHDDDEPEQTRQLLKIRRNQKSSNWFLFIVNTNLYRYKFQRCNSAREQKP